MDSPDQPAEPALRKLPNRFTETSADGEIVIMRQDSGAFLILSGTGATVWRLIDSRLTRAELIAALAHDYVVDCDEITVEVESFLSQLRAEGLIAGA